MEVKATNSYSLWLVMLSMNLRVNSKKVMVSLQADRVAPEV
jgi:hypothetical protein